MIISFMTHHHSISPSNDIHRVDLQYNFGLWFNMDSIHKLVAQYFQLVELPNLDLPPGSVLVRQDVQSALYQHMFDESIFPIPPDSYRSRVLKEIITRIEESIADPEQDVCEPIIITFNRYIHYKFLSSTNSCKYIGLTYPLGD